jgi:hypothetical protein
VGRYKNTILTVAHTLYYLQIHDNKVKRHPKFLPNSDINLANPLGKPANIYRKLNPKKYMFLMILQLPSKENRRKAPRWGAMINRRKE